MFKNKTITGNNGKEYTYKYIERPKIIADLLWPYERVEVKDDKEKETT